MRRTWTAFLTVIAAGTLVAASVFAFGVGHRRPAGGERENEALERAGHVGIAVAPRDTNRITRAEAHALAPLAPAAGWAGEIKVGTEDTWEPTVAADPGAPYVYVMYNRFGGTKACKQCPGIPMLLRVSNDNGATWGPETFPCPCPGVKGFQYDPVLKVASNGVVYATWMNRYDMVFSKSSNHGASWTTPIEVSGQPWGDKPWIGVSPNGQDVYIAYSTSSDVWIAASHNAGASFAPSVKLNNDSGRYRYPNGFEVLANGTAVLSASDYPGSSHQASGQVNIETWRSTNGGASWARTVIDQVHTGVNFETSSTTTVGSDAAGTLVAMYSGATTQGATGHIWSRRSTDGGVTWSTRIELGRSSANASFPAIAGGASGVFRIHYADDRTGSWNTWYRASTDGGVTWGADVDIADADTGATYKTAAGFASEYGDYGAIDITNTGKTVAVWGEGASFSTGPGGIWFNRQL
ncbi:MAG: sialidase family protein [Actinomycetota bacterium]